MINVGVLLFQNMRSAPYFETYEKLLDNLDNVTYKTLFFNRDASIGEKADSKREFICWKGPLKNKYFKVWNCMRYAQAAKKFIKKNKFDYVIVLTTMPAVLLCDFLEKEYKGRYIVDIRDYTQEHSSTYFKKEEKAVRNSALTVISSPGFKAFLPKANYEIFHNLSYVPSKEQKYIFEKAKDRRIIISNTGGISYKKQFKQLIDLVDKDERFEFHLYGVDNTSGEITNYINALNNPRIVLKGAFSPEQKEEIYSKSDIAFNCYGNDRTLVKYAISNRFYDGAFFKTPLIVSPETVMEQVSEGFAHALDLDRLTNLNGLYKWYTELDESEYNTFAEKVINQSWEENKKTERKIKEVLK